jgi:hypothetical protein
LIRASPVDTHRPGSFAFFDFPQSRQPLCRNRPRQLQIGPADSLYCFSRSASISSSRVHLAPSLDIELLDARRLAGQVTTTWLRLGGARNSSFHPPETDSPFLRLPDFRNTLP